MNTLKVVAIAFLAIILLSRRSEAAISCSDVMNDLQPCVTYLVSGSGKPPEACCQGVKAMAAAATTTEDKKAACECIKSASKSVTPKPELAQGLASNCGVNLSITVTPNTDCSTIG